MEKESKGIFDSIDGLTFVDAAALEEYKQAMTEEVIPEIVRVVEERQALAVESSKRLIK